MNAASSMPAQITAIGPRLIGVSLMVRYQPNCATAADTTQAAAAQRTAMSGIRAMLITKARSIPRSSAAGAAAPAGGAVIRWFAMAEASWGFGRGSEPVCLDPGPGRHVGPARGG